MAQIKGHARSLGTDHQLAGVLRPGSSLGRAAVWASALGGVLETDDLSRYLPDVFGDTRLARQTNLDLLLAWGVPEDLLRSSGVLVDELAAEGPLAR